MTHHDSHRHHHHHHGHDHHHKRKSHSDKTHHQDDDDSSPKEQEEFFTATVYKESKEQMCGITLVQEHKDGPVTIGCLQDGSLFHNTDLLVGMELVSINHILVDNNKSDALWIIRQVQGELTIVAKAVEGGAVAALILNNPEQPCGVRFEQRLVVQQGHPIISIANIDSDSVFANSKLEVGMKVVSVNNVPIDGMRHTVSQVMDLLLNNNNNSRNDNKISIVTHPNDDDPWSKETSTACKNKTKNHSSRPSATNNDDTVLAKKQHYDEETAVGELMVPTKSIGKPPPPGVAEGGQWGYVVHVGDQTLMTSIFCCLFCGLFPAGVICCLPFDKKRAYRLSGVKCFDKHGNPLPVGNGSTFQEEDPFRPGTDSDRRLKSWVVAFIVMLICAVLFYLFLTSAASNSQ